MTMIPAKLFTIIRREYVERIRSKWFLIATFLGPVLMGLFMVLPAIMAQRERRAESGVVRVLDSTTDSVGAVIVSTLRGGVMGDTTRVQYRHVSDSTAILEAVRKATDAVLAGELVGYLEVGTGSLERGTVHYAGKNTSSLMGMQLLERAINRAVLQKSLLRAGVDADRSESIAAAQLRLDTERLTTRGRGGSGTIGMVFALAIALTLYMTIFLHGSAVMRGVLEEKQSRVAEVVLSSVSSDTLLLGKVLGIGGIGVTQLATWVLMATAMLRLRGPLLAHFGVQDAAFALPELGLAMGVTILLTFLLGFLLYAALFAMVGAVVSTEQDAQQAQMPVVLLLVLTFSMVQGILNNPEGMLARVLTIVPFSAPIVLPLRLSLAPLGTGELVAAFTSMSITAVVVMRLASRLYRVGILMYGKRPSLAEAWRWIQQR
ncbi:MAG: ABC transporter permease [Gemmatimonadaceae bacterium]